MNSLAHKFESLLYSGIRIVSMVTILFGGILFVASLNLVSNLGQAANTAGSIYNDSTTYVNSTDSDSSTTLNSPISPTSQVINTPETTLSSSMAFNTSIPLNVTNSFEVTIGLIAIAEPRLHIRGLDNSVNILLEPFSVSPTSARFVVPFERLLPGRFELQARGRKSDGLTLIAFGPRFEIVSTPTSVETNDTGVVGIPLTQNTNNFLQPTTTEEDANAITNPIGLVENPDMILNDEGVKTGALAINLTLPHQTEYRGFVPIQIHTTSKVATVSIFVQSPLTAKSQFLGTARYYPEGQWMFIVDTNNIPDGKYHIYASTELSDVRVESERHQFHIFNSVSTEQYINLESNLVNDERLKLSPVESPTTKDSVLTASPKTPTEIRESQTPEFIGNPGRAIESIVLSDTLKVLIPKILKEYQSKINLSLKNYNEEVRETSTTSPADIDKVVQEVMNMLLTDSRLESISAEAIQRLHDEIELLVKNSVRMEVLLVRKTKTKQEAEDFARDLATSIVIPEDSLVDVGSPREFGLVREDILRVESVSPITVVDTVSNSKKVYTEIRGRALPNTLVTLYIYSSPVMVTVQADSDGTFTYVYEKDLEGGEHEVYVALTTNTGAVAVKSEGFQFVREAEAFTVTNSDNGDILVPVIKNESLLGSPYFKIMSVSLSAIGFVLLFLGLQYGNRRPEDEEISPS